MRLETRHPTGVHSCPVGESSAAAEFPRVNHTRSVNAKIGLACRRGEMKPTLTYAIRVPKQFASRCRKAVISRQKTLQNVANGEAVATPVARQCDSCCVARRIVFLGWLWIANRGNWSTPAQTANRGRSARAGVVKLALLIAAPIQRGGGRTP